MPKQLLEALLKSISFIPGIVGMAAMDLSKTNGALKEESWDKGIQIIESPKGLDVSIAIIASKDINTKIIAKEINQAVKVSMKAAGTKLSSLNIYIRGVK